MSHIQKTTPDSDIKDAIINSLHNSTGLFGSRNQYLLPTLNLNFVKDTRNYARLFFKNGVLEISEDSISLQPYDDFEGHVWEKNIINHPFSPVSLAELYTHCHFMGFLHDITEVTDTEESERRFNSLQSIIGYLSHRYKDPVRTKAVILMDASPSGNPNGRTGKTLICQAISKLRTMSILDGKSYDQKRWFRFSSVGHSTDIMLFDDIQKNFNMELLFPLMTTGLHIQRKYKDDVFISFEESPKVVLTTNYAVAGEGSSFKARTFEFEISNTYNADYQPADKYGKRFFEDWDATEWNLFYNLIAHCIKYYLLHGLVKSEPINIKLSKLTNQTHEEFVEFCMANISKDVQYDKQVLFSRFIREYPDFRNQSRRTFLNWLKRYGNYIGAIVEEGHSGDIRHIVFTSKID
jgi:hypothetical protein